MLLFVNQRIDDIIIFRYPPTQTQAHSPATTNEKSKRKEMANVENPATKSDREESEENLMTPLWLCSVAPNWSAPHSVIV